MGRSHLHGMQDLHTEEGWQRASAAFVARQATLGELEPVLPSAPCTLGQPLTVCLCTSRLKVLCETLITFADMCVGRSCWGLETCCGSA